MNHFLYLQYVNCIVLPDVAGTTINNLNEEKIAEKVFELIFAFDEVITAGGYKESINLQQIRTNMEMESHEEKLHNMIKISKMDTAREAAKDAAKSIREKKSQGMGPSGLGNTVLEFTNSSGDLRKLTNVMCVFTNEVCNLR
jgi:hypothetical protein